jgi:hypothetical protein
MGRTRIGCLGLGVLLTAACALENPRLIIPADVPLADAAYLDADVLRTDAPAPGDTPDAVDAPENCGAAGQRCCEPDRTCREGACASNGFCTTCGAGQQLCDGRCVDPQSDNAHCGACGNACAADGSTVCARGQCIVSNCPPGAGDCNRDAADGCETQLSTTVAHCGTCGNACQTANGTPGCIDGACVLAQCNTGFRDCDGLQSTGCEADVARSLEHCGSCGVRCAPANAASARCEEGRCFVSACNTLYGDCNNDPADGCETDLARSTDHCGACNTRCTATGGTAVCNVGRCGVSRCDPGRGDCDGNAGNGCETSLRDTLAHCGACGAACPALPRATTVCRDARCAIGSCNNGWGDCNTNPADGCETDLTAAVNHCGACGRRCALARAVADCTSGRCTVASCERGFGNCDNNAENGCETNVNNTVAHCGRCDNACPARANASRTCSGGQCGFQCNTGFGNCDGNAGNGCETNVTSSMAHCGGCGRVCTAPTGGSAVCTNGNCVRTCPMGQQNCGGVCRPAGACTSAGSGGCQTTGMLVCMGTNSVCNAAPRTGGGCTTPAGGQCRMGGVCGCPGGQTDCSGTCRNLSNTLGHCGACGRACTAPTGGTATCTNGTCNQSCPSGQANCNGTCRNLATDPQHCGACGMACAMGLVCAARVCTCPSGQTLCSGACVDLRSNADHCGMCGVRCASGMCQAGACACPAGQTACGPSNDTCVDTQTDAQHCGGCGRACMAPTARCMGGMCVGG